jgi:hypothetical protein
MGGTRYRAGRDESRRVGLPILDRVPQTGPRNKARSTTASGDMPLVATRSRSARDWWFATPTREIDLISLPQAECEECPAGSFCLFTQMSSDKTQR